MFSVVNREKKKIKTSTLWIVGRLSVKHGHGIIKREPSLVAPEQKQNVPLSRSDSGHFNRGGENWHPFIIVVNE